MNAATLLTLTACALEVVMGSLALASASAEGWRHFRAFAVIAFSAAVYSLGNSVFASADPPAMLVVLAGRLNLAVACLHCAAWIVYVRLQYGEPLRRFERVGVGLLATIAALAAIPGLIMGQPVMVQQVEWAGITYHVPTATWLGLTLMLVVPLFLAIPAATY